MNVWEWITSGTPEGFFSQIGLGAIAVLFATNRILTIGQHRSRVADIKEFNAALVAEKDRQIQAQTIRGDYYRDAYNQERETSEKLMDGLLEAQGTAALTSEALDRLTRAAEEATK